VKDDLKIEIPEELFLVREFRVRVESIQDLTPENKGVRFRILEPEEGIVFKAGQYVQLRIPKYKLSKEPEYRAYSISSDSEEHGSLELVITRMVGGILSTYVHDYLKEGEELIISGPFGDFYLRDSDRDILFIATGSGLAPIKSMVHQMGREQIQRKATFFFGDKTPKDLYYYDEFKDFERTIPHFSFVPTLSRTLQGDQWQGEKGRVTDLIEKNIPDNANIDVYICGLPAMVQSCIDLLIKKGIPEDRIFFDKFE
jgi:Na+-transporting NADH:ubiquinone oxidoreductase subunit F